MTHDNQDLEHTCEYDVIMIKNDQLTKHCMCGNKIILQKSGQKISLSMETG